MSSTLIDAPPNQSVAWVEWRTHGLGASELPTVAGVDPYRTPYQLAALKRGDAPAFEGNAATAWGHRMEAVGLEVYREATGCGPIATGETFGDPRWPHLWASLDGRAERIGVEVKWTARWDVVPQRVEVQGLGQIGLADLDAVDVVRLSPYGEPTITRIERDDGIIADLLDLGEAWYVRYVLGDEMPPLDGSPEARRALDRLAGPAEMRADETQAQMVRSLRVVRRGISDLETSEAGLIRAIKASMVGGGLLLGDGFRVRWTPVKGRTSTDWKAAFADLVALDRVGLPGGALDAFDDAVGAIVADHTETGDGGTSFTPKWDEEDQADGG